MRAHYIPIAAALVLLPLTNLKAQTDGDTTEEQGSGCSCEESHWIAENWYIVDIAAGCVNECESELLGYNLACADNCMQVILAPYLSSSCSQCFRDYWDYRYTMCASICYQGTAAQCLDCFAEQLEQLWECIRVQEVVGPGASVSYIPYDADCGGCEPSYAYLARTTGCDYTLNGVTYSASGLYTQVIENVAGCDSIITLDLSIDPLVVNAGGDATVYYGPYMGAACTTLTGTASGGAGVLQLAWDGGEQGVGSSLSQSVCPTTDMTYTFTATDADGCEASDQVLVSAVDLACGNGGGKVYICLNGTTVCANLNAVTALLENHPNASVGPCPSNKALEVEEGGFGVHPNPSDGQSLTITVGHWGRTGGTMVVDLYDLSGQLVRSTSVALAGEVAVPFPLNGELAAGVYLLQLALAGERHTERVVIKP